MVRTEANLYHWALEYKNEVEKNALLIHENRYETRLDEVAYTQSTSDDELEDKCFNPSPRHHTELHDKTSRVLLIADSMIISKSQIQKRRLCGPVIT